MNLPARMLRALPAGLDLRTAALIEPASVAWHAVSRAGDVAGKTALVIGSGPIGALAVAVLKRAGAARIVAVDMHDKPLEIAAAVGADEVLKGDNAEAIAAVEADVVIESSGSHHGLASAIKGAVRGGTVVMVGLLPSGPQPVLISLAITRELDLLGSFRFNDEIDDVIAALADGTLHISPGSHPRIPAQPRPGSLRGGQELRRIRKGTPQLPAGGSGPAGDQSRPCGPQSSGTGMKTRGWSFHAGTSPRMVSRMIWFGGLPGRRGVTGGDRFGPRQHATAGHFRAGGPA